MPENLNLKFRSKFNPIFTCHGCLNYAILRPIYGFKVRRDHKAKHSRFPFQNVQNEIFEILKMFKNNMKIARAGCWINTKFSNSDYKTTLGPIL